MSEWRVRLVGAALLLGACLFVAAVLLAFVGVLAIANGF